MAFSLNQKMGQKRYQFLDYEENIMIYLLGLFGKVRYLFILMRYIQEEKSNGLN